MAVLNNNGIVHNHSMKKSKVVLDIEHVEQMNPSASGAACAEMAFKHAGFDANQRGIYEKARLAEGKTCTDAGIALSVADSGYKVVSWWNENKNAPLEWTGVMQNFYWPLYWRAVKNGALEKRENADTHLIKELINKGLPVIAEVDNGKFYNKKSSWTQFILIKGYSRTHFTYNDPSMKSGGKTIEFKKFEGSWMETPFVNRSMFVVVKKDQMV